MQFPEKNRLAVAAVLALSGAIAQAQPTNSEVKALKNTVDELRRQVQELKRTQRPDTDALEKARVDELRKQLDEQIKRVEDGMDPMNVWHDKSPDVIFGAGEPPQSTEAKIGPYALQDFTLFYTLRYGFRPSKIAFMALHAWEDAARGAWPPHFPPERRQAYDLPTIRRWLEVFLRRFFATSQFKRSAMPNGPKVSAGGSLSPRGDWRAPSDSEAAVWLADLDRIPDEHA